MKKLIKNFLPPILLKALPYSKNKYGFSGIYKTWQEARTKTTGYDSDVIIEKVKNAALQVKQGKAVYERDSVIFNRVQYSWPVLTSLLWIASKNNNELNVLDFGGALGTSYFQNRDMLSHLKLSWNIVEQAKFVNYGQQLFANEHLRFFNDIATCFKDQKPRIALCSSVLQYLENPYVVLDQLRSLEYLIIDRTPFYEGTSDLITIQKVPAHIYSASYPSWIFSRNKFLAFIKQSHRLVTPLETQKILDLNNLNIKFEGFLFEHI